MRKKLVLLGIFFLSQASASWAQCPVDDAWVWNYKKKFTPEQMQNNAEKHVLLFEKTGVPAFSQLLFSWNAFRPEAGFFSFFVRTRDAATQEWGPWHKGIDWGQGVQRTYSSDPGQSSKTLYLHVRLEAKKGNLSDAFIVKVVPCDGASLCAVQALAVCTSDLNKFKGETDSTALLSLPSVCVKNVPRKSQRVIDHPRSGAMCSPTSCSMVTSFFTGKDIDPRGFAERVYDSGLNGYGSWPFNVAHAFERCAGAMYFYTTRMPSFASIHHQLKRGIPTVVSVRGFVDGAPKIYESGHLLVVVGWDAKRGLVVCHDPALPTDQATLMKYSLQTFLAAWERSHRLAYCAEPKGTKRAG